MQSQLCLIPLLSLPWPQHLREADQMDPKKQLRQVEAKELLKEVSAYFAVHKRKMQRRDWEPCGDEWDQPRDVIN